MVELEVYAAGVRNTDKVMGLALELDSIPGLHYKVDTNHDIVYMEFSQEIPDLAHIKSIFSRVELNAKFVGALPPQVTSKKKTQKLEL